MTGKLERSLSLGGGVGLIVGLVIGASIFVLIPTLAGMTGPSLYLAYAVSVVPTIFTALYLIQLGGAMPVTGANYFIITRILSPGAGFATSVAAVIGMISTNCLVAWGFAEYVKTYVPGVNVTFVAIGIVLLFGAINWLGVRTFEWIQVIMILFLIVAMLIFGVAGMFNVDPALHHPLFPNGTGKFFMVIAIATFSWGGFVAITEVAGEVKNPKKNIPLAILISLVIVMVLYVVQTYVFTGVLRWDRAAEIGPTAFIAAAALFLPAWAVNFIVISALLAMATTINAILLMAARETLAWGRDSIIPQIFRRISRFGTPDMTILAMTLLSVVGVLFAAELDRYALMVVFALMVAQGLGAVAVWRMPYAMPEIYNSSLFRFSPFWRCFIWVGCMICFTLIFLFGWLADWKTGVVFSIIVASGMVYWQARKYFLKKRGMLLNESVKRISEEAIAEMEGA